MKKAKALRALIATSSAITSLLPENLKKKAQENKPSEVIDIDFDASNLI